MHKQISKPRLPLLLEFSIIITISLGYFIYSALKWAAIAPVGKVALVYGNNEVLQILCYEALAMIIVMSFIKWQGKSLSDFGFSISLQEFTSGLVLFVIIYFLYLMMFRLFSGFVLNLNFLNNNPSENIEYSTTANTMLLIFFCIINPVFEELILVGYIVTTFRKNKGLISCLILSVGLRLAFHIYQGPIIFLSILTMGVVFLIYYWYRKNIIPLIIAHSLLDLLNFFILLIKENNS